MRTKKKQYNLIGLQAGNTLTNLTDDIRRAFSTYYQMYRVSADIRRCVDIVANTVAKKGFKTMKGENDVVDARVEALLLNSGGFQNFKRQVLQHAQISGNIFIFQELNARGEPLKLEVLDSRYISIVTNSDGSEVFSYRYKKDMEVIDYPADYIIHGWTMKDPDNKWFGLSALETIIYDSLGDEEANKSNFAFFKNNAISGNFIKLKEGIDPDEARLLKDQMKIELAGARNAHKDLIADFIDEIKPMQQSHTEMDFLNQRKYATEKVCATLGVPRTLLNYTDGVNYSNSETQYKIFIENTIIPWETMLDELLTKVLAPYDLEVVIISDHIDRLGDMADLTDKLIGNGTITRNEARILLKQPISDAQEMDSHTVSSSTTLLDNLIMQGNLDPSLPQGATSI